MEIESRGDIELAFVMHLRRQNTRKKKKLSPVSPCLPLDWNYDQMMPREIQIYIAEFLCGTIIDKCICGSKECDYDECVIPVLIHERSSVVRLSLTSHFTRQTIRDEAEKRYRKFLEAEKVKFPFLKLATVIPASRLHAFLLAHEEDGGLQQMKFEFICYDLPYPRHPSDDSCNLGWMRQCWLGVGQKMLPFSYRAGWSGQTMTTISQLHRRHRMLRVMKWKMNDIPHTNLVVLTTSSGDKDVHVHREDGLHPPYILSGGSPSRNNNDKLNWRAVGWQRFRTLCVYSSRIDEAM
jgi:hypothetical protein